MAHLVGGCFILFERKLGDRMIFVVFDEQLLGEKTTKPPASSRSCRSAKTLKPLGGLKSLRNPKPHQNGSKNPWDLSRKPPPPLPESCNSKFCPLNIHQGPQKEAGLNFQSHHCSVLKLPRCWCFGALNFETHPWIDHESHLGWLFHH